MSSSPTRRGRPSGLTGSGLLAVAREVFLERGYAGASMDEVANRARISKSSLYREHASKDGLYAAVVEDWVRAGRHGMQPALDRLVVETDVRRGLIDLGETMRAGVLSPPVMQMRRLIISEASARPEVATMYLQQSWDRNIANLGDALQRLAANGHLTTTKPRQAAEQLTWLILGAPLNAMLLAPEGVHNFSSVEDVTDLFLARYGPGST